MCSHESLGAVHMCSHESDTGSLSDQGINEKKKKNDTLQDASAVTPSIGHVQLIRSVSDTHEQQIIPDEEEDREVTTTLQERDFGLLGPKLDQILHHQIHQIHHHNPHAPADSGEKTAVASHALQNQQLMYAFRPRNPKRSRRFSDQDSDATATATATNSKEEIMVIYKRNPENISTVCAASSSSTTTSTSSCTTMTSSTTTMESSSGFFTHYCCADLDTTNGSMPSRPLGFAESFTSNDGR